MSCADAIGFQAAAALEAYEEDLAGLLARGADAAAMARLQLRLRQACTCCLPLPQLSASAVALMLAHHRFLADFCRSGGNAAQPEAARSLRTLEHCAAVLKGGCRELFVAAHLH